MEGKINSDATELIGDNAQIYNTVLKYAPKDFQSRYAPATEGNIESRLKQLAENSYTPDFELFWNILVTRIGRTIIENRTMFENPLAKFKRASLQYGATIQEIKANLIRAKDYDPNDINVFGKEGREPEIAQAFHTLNRKHKYEINVPMQQMLLGSFIEGDSLANFINSLLKVPIDSSVNHEYRLMLNLFSQYDKYEGFYNVKVPDLRDKSLTFDERKNAAADLAEAVRSMHTRLKYYRTEFSPLGRTREFYSKTDEDLFIIDSDVEAAFDVRSLAVAYNKSEADFIADNLVVVDEMPVGPECQAILVDRDFLMVANTFDPIMLSSPINSSNMSVNYFYHVWQILSYSIFTNAVMFSTRPDTDITNLVSTVTDIKLLDKDGNVEKTISAGEKVNLHVEVAGANNPTPAVVYEIATYDGNGITLGLPTTVRIDSYGTVYTQGMVAPGTIKVRATSVIDNTKTAEYTIKVADPNKPSS